MSNSKKRVKAKSRKSEGGFLALPHAVTSSEDFRGLKGSTCKLLIAIASQYKGGNNGDLHATFSLAKKWGIGSESTLDKAINELIKKNLIIKTRQGFYRNRTCSLFAVTWQAINECNGKLDIAPTTAPPRAFSMENKKLPSTEIVGTGYKNRSDETASPPSIRNSDYKSCSDKAAFLLPIPTKTVDLSNIPMGIASISGCNYQQQNRCDT